MFTYSVTRIVDLHHHLLLWNSLSFCFHRTATIKTFSCALWRTRHDT